MVGMHQSLLANSTIRQVKQRRTVPGCSASAGRRAGFGWEQGSMWPLAALDVRVHIAPSSPPALALLRSGAEVPAPGGQERENCSVPHPQLHS